MSLFLTDRALLEGFRRGERTALTRVYQTYAERILEELCRGLWVRTDDGPMRLVLGPLDVDAVLQETFLRAFTPSARQAYDGLRPYWPWLLTIARSAAIDLLRSDGRRPRGTVSVERIAEVIPTEGATPESAALSGETRDLVRSFLAQLPERERRFVHLRFVDGLSQEQAGAELGHSRQSARTLESRVRKRLVKHLRAEGWLDGERPRVTRGALRTGALGLLLRLLP